jgi:hypothetical protein
MGRGFEGGELEAEVRREGTVEVVREDVGPPEVPLEVVGGYAGMVVAGAEDGVGVLRDEVLAASGVEGPDSVEDVFGLGGEGDFGLAVGGEVLLEGKFGGDFVVDGGG